MFFWLTHEQVGARQFEDEIQQRYYERVVSKQASFHTMITLPTTEQFTLRKQQLYDCLTTVAKLNVSRTIMCFNIDTTGVYAQLEQFFIDFISFLKISLLISIFSVIKITQGRA